ncbi:Predicted deacylase [Marinobacter daqiaonensis]|uniref:Predicted deacylase n=1 Tax=Marinobacter daqiaonensis TaxID=650891 RepID=A0A1I6I9P4_9GAMM|nr:succinylglutamate desuccinylase/aspartoacylase family protein [Marinobacter daqiaonensis]SFR63401.1 Predicted deacylase [Marinobacter daqiaonensis]
MHLNHRCASIIFAFVAGLGFLIAAPFSSAQETSTASEAAGKTSSDAGSSPQLPVIELPEDESVEDIPVPDGSALSTKPDVPPDPVVSGDRLPRADDAPESLENAPGSSPPASGGDDNSDTGSTGPGERQDIAPGGEPATLEVIPETRPAQAGPFHMLSGKVLPGTTARLAWSPGIQIAGLSQPTPVLVVNGSRPGPVLCMTGAVHGDELNGIEIIRRVVYDLDPKELSGTVVGIPIVNLQGFQQGSRYLADRRDLNRYFPGSPEGSLAHRVAHSLFEQVIQKCTMLVDIHTGSLKRTNLPQLRADMNQPAVAELSRGFDAMVVVHSPGSPGMLRSAATDAGVPAVTMEVGESMRIQEDHIDAGVNSLFSLLEKQGMTARFFQWSKPEPVYYRSHWIRANQGGILFSDVKLGAYVTEGTVLGVVSDPITNEQSAIRADSDGRVIGMAVDQVVMAGFAAYHLGSRAEIPAEE